MEKYYKPELHEFHIGFIYEFLNGENWEEDEVTIKDYQSPRITEGGLSWFDEEIIGGIRDYRVKYLDQQDIEDLGFEVFNKEENLDKICPSIWVHFKYKKDKLNQIYCQLHPYHYLRNKGITLNMKLRYGNFKCVVKNKSEFKRLLKQLNII